MTEYHFTGACPRVLAGLSQGVNAWLTPAAGDAPPYGSTLEACPGDLISTDEPYEHPELTVAVPVPDAPAPAPTEPSAVPIQLVAAPDPAPAPADPAHDTMTAEGAPAPAATN